MTVSNRTELSICTDCYMYSHYGDEGFGDYVSQDMVHGIRRGFDKLGNVRLEDSHRDCDHHWDCVCIEASRGSFRWSPCDICESGLGGDRHDVETMTV